MNYYTSVMTTSGFWILTNEYVFKHSEDFSMIARDWGFMRVTASVNHQYNGQKTYALCATKEKTSKGDLNI
jgi:hypothetical protein